MRTIRLPRLPRLPRPKRWALMLAGLAAITLPAASLRGQEPARLAGTPVRLTPNAARRMAQRASPELMAAREAVAAAAARERQAGSLPNPLLSYQHEQTSGGGETASQTIVSVDQSIDLSGTRVARIAVARIRREVAEARLAAAQAQLDFDVSRAFALAVAADRRAALADLAATAFTRARTVSQARLVAGDVSGYAHRRVQLEAARYAGLLAEATLARRTARLALASFLTSSADSTAWMQRTELVLDDSLPDSPPAVPDDSLRALALRHRAEVRVAMLEAEAASAATRLATRERVPVPLLTAGFKAEQVIGAGDFNGFIAGISLPIPLFDRRRGTIEAAGAEARRRASETEIVRRRVVREVAEAMEALRAVEEQLGLLRPHLGVESRTALGAAEAAYAEGEISLVEWLDAVRAYQEVEATFASLRSEAFIQQAALDRAVGVPFSRDSR